MKKVVLPCKTNVFGTRKLRTLPCTVYLVQPTKFSAVVKFPTLVTCTALLKFEPS